MRVVVCGSRTWTNRQAISDRLAELPTGTLIIHGGANGADATAESVAGELDLHTAVVKARWWRGRRAGPDRNRVMLDLEPDVVIAFSHGTPGTQDTIAEAQRRGIPVEVHGTESLSDGGTA